MALRCSRRESPRRRSLRCSRSSGPPEPSPAVGETCERGVWNLKERLVWLSPHPPLPLSPQRSPASRFHSETPAGPVIIAPAVVPARAPQKRASQRHQPYSAVFGVPTLAWPPNPALMTARLGGGGFIPRSCGWRIWQCRRLLWGWFLWLVWLVSVALALCRHRQRTRRWSRASSAPC